MKSYEKINVSSLTDVPETMLIPLYFKAKETRENGIIRDDKAIEIVDRIDYNFSRMDADWKTQTGVAVRTWLFDDILKSLIEKTKGQLVVVNLGAGLDTRQERFPGVKWYQVDLPQSIAIRKLFFTTGDATLIARSALDFSWADDVKEKENVLFIAEGLFMYFTANEVRSILNFIGSHFTHSYIAFNTIHKSMVGQPHQSVDTRKAPFQWGLQSMKEIEDWHTGLKESRIFSPLKYFRKRWGWLRWLTLIPSYTAGFAIIVMQTEK